MNCPKLPKLIFLAAALAATSYASTASAATIAFANEFTSTGFANTSGFTLNTTSPGTITSTVSGSATPVAYGSEQFSNAADATWTMRTDFQITALSANPSGDQTIGFGVFATNSSFTGGAASPYLLADWTFRSNTAVDGRLRLLEIAASNTGIGTNGLADDSTTSGVAAVLDKVYTLQLVVTNVAANQYDLSLSLLHNNLQIGTAATATAYTAITEPSGGYYLGLRTRMPNTSGTSSVVFDNFSVIPEPSSAILLSVGALALALLRRRR